MIPKKINIAHLTHSFGTGGIENGIINLVNRMNHNLFNHYVICFVSIGTSQNRITSKNVEITSLNKGPGNSLKPFFLLRNFFIKNKIDVVHSRGWATMVEGIVSARLAHVPVVIYGFHGKTYEDVQGEKRRRIVAHKILLKMTDGIVTLIDDMRKDFCNSMNISEEKVEIIKNGVDLTRFNKGNQRLRYDFGIKDEDFVMGAVGRLDPVKNYETMIDAFKIVSSKYDDMKLILVGDGSEYAEIENKILNMGLSKKVLMLGDRDDVPVLLNCLDVFVQPSLYEGLSNTILEAMAVGLPIIASRVGGNPDVIIEEENGLLFEPTDVEGLAIAIENIYLKKELREKMSVANREKINNEFSLEKMVGQYERYYQRLLLKKQDGIVQ